MKSDRSSPATVALSTVGHRRRDRRDLLLGVAALTSPDDGASAGEGTTTNTHRPGTRVTGYGCLDLAGLVVLYGMY